MQLILISVLLVVGCIASDCAAESPHSVYAGDTVRVTIPSRHLRKETGIVVSQSGDSLGLAIHGTKKEYLVTRTEITSLQVQRGRRKTVVESMVFFGALGAGLGAAAGYASPKASGSEGPTHQDRVNSAVGRALIEGAIGTILGLGLGETITKPNWKKVELWPDLALENHNGVGLVVSMRF